MENIKAVVRDEMLFAGLREPINSREELIPKIEVVRNTCGDRIAGPLTHIFRFDTPVDGFDSEIGFPISSEARGEGIRTHTLRELSFFSLTHRGPVEELMHTTGKIYAHMNQTGLAPELELMEIYNRYDPQDQEDNLIEVRASYLAWPQVYRQQLLRVLTPELAEEIWSGGADITPFTPVDERAAWVAASLERLKPRTNKEQQFDILSRVALVRPGEDVNKYKKIYEETKDINRVLEMQNRQLADTPTGGFIDPPWFDGDVLHLSKVAYNREAYDAAQTQDEIRKAYCFFALIREAEAPQVDPIFCYRAAGWARQLWEPILGIEFDRCTITHSILKGDAFCAWDYHLN